MNIDRFKHTHTHTHTLTHIYTCPVGWDCRVHRLHLCRGVRPPPNKYLGYDTKQSDDGVLSNFGALGNVEYSFFAITLRSTQAQSGST